MSSIKRLWAYVLAEPTAAAAIIQAVVPALVFFHAVGLSDTQLGVIAAAIAAIQLAVVAFLTHHPTYAVMVGVVQGLAALGGSFGYHISAHNLATIIVAVGVVGHASNWAGSSSRVLAPARPALGKGPYRPEESPTFTPAAAPVVSAAPSPTASTGSNVTVKPATKRAKKTAPTAD